MKPLGWIAALGVLSADPACADVLWTPVRAEDPDNESEQDEGWIDPFAAKPNSKANESDPVRWKQVIQKSPSQRNTVTWRSVTSAEEIQQATAQQTKAPVYVQQMAPQIPLIGASNQTQWVVVGHEIPPEGLGENLKEKNKRPTKLSLPPALQALNRSVAYSDGYAGPDISWKVPNGLQWSERWRVDATVRGFSRRTEGEDFAAWNDGDASAQIHLNIISSENWSAGINTSVRSVYQGDQAVGGSTKIGEGVSSGFRIAKAIGDTGGIAFGGEQIIQWDSFTDTGRNFYLMATKGWWLGEQGRTFPLFIANGGIATGRLANNENLRIKCFEDIDNRRGTYSIDNNLCFGPIGSLALAFSSNWASFIEYNSGDSIAGLSVNAGFSYPIRLTLGIMLGNGQEFYSTKEARWVFRGSIGF